MRHVSDSRNIVGLEGLRWVKKVDQVWASAKEYQIEFAFKGQESVIRYTDLEERDAMFNRISEALKEKK